MATEICSGYTSKGERCTKEATHYTKSVRVIFLITYYCLEHAPPGSYTRETV